MPHRIAALGAAAGIVAAACGQTAAPSAAPAAASSAPVSVAPSATATKSPPAKVRIIVGGLNKQIYLPNKLTQALGYFTDENVDADVIDEGSSGVTTENAVLSGGADLGSGAYDHTIELQAAGKNVTEVVVLLQAPGEFVMHSKRVAARIKSAADWKGLSAGVTSLGSGTHTLMRAIAARAGLQVSDVSYVTAGAGDQFISAMTKGTIDIGITTQPTVLRLVKTGEAVIGIDMSKPEDTRTALGGDWPFISLYGRSDWVSQNKAVVQRVANAYVRTLKWIQTHAAEEIADKVPADYYVGDKAGYIQALKDSMKMFSPDGRMPAGGPEFALKTHQLFNETVRKATIDLSRTFTNEFVDAAR